MRSIPRESTPATSPHPRTTRMSSNAWVKPSRRPEEKEGASVTSRQAQPHAHTPPRHPTSVHARTPAAPTAPREPRVRHSTTRPNPRPAAPPPNLQGGYSLGRAQATRRRRSLPPQQPAHPPQQAPATANMPVGRAAQKPPRPDNPHNVTPYSGQSLPATQPDTTAEPHPEESKRTGSRWTPNGAEPKPASVGTA